MEFINKYCTTKYLRLMKIFKKKTQKTTTTKTNRGSFDGRKDNAAPGRSPHSTPAAAHTYGAGATSLWKFWACEPSSAAPTSFNQRRYFAECTGVVITTHGAAACPKRQSCSKAYIYFTTAGMYIRSAVIRHTKFDQMPSPETQAVGHNCISEERARNGQR